MTLRMEPFGQTRTNVSFDHAIIGPDSHVIAPLANWQSTSGIVLISPAMGSFPKSPRFAQYIAHITDQSWSTCASPGVQRLIYVLDGSIKLNQSLLTQDMFAWLPPDASYDLQGREAGRLLVFEKPYSTIEGTKTPSLLIGNLQDIQAEPFMGDTSAMLSTLLPIDTSFDMAVNVFTYESGATLPFVETHVMEHGLYMRSGQGIYRLSNHWYPVQKGDSIWMAAYCPQWFVAMGKESASYIYYKDIHRDPLLMKPTKDSIGI